MPGIGNHGIESHGRRVTDIGNSIEQNGYTHEYDINANA